MLRNDRVENATRSALADVSQCGAVRRPFELRGGNSGACVDEHCRFFGTSQRNRPDLSRPQIDDAIALRGYSRRVSLGDFTRLIARSYDPDCLLDARRVRCRIGIGTAEKLEVAAANVDDRMPVGSPTQSSNILT